MAEQHIEIFNSWKITGRGMIAELKHQSPTGLAHGTRIASKQTGLQWTVKSRLFFNHTADKQKEFANETKHVVRLSFNDIEISEKSKIDILERELQGVYQYHIDPYEHDEKPLTGDLLYVVS